MDGRKSGYKDNGILREETGHEESRKLSTIVRPNIVLVILYIKISYFVDDNASLPPANEVLGKVMFLHLSVCSYDSLPTGGSTSRGSAYRVVCIRGGWADLPLPRTRKAGGTHPTGSAEFYAKRNENSKCEYNLGWTVFVLYFCIVHCF